MSIWIPNALRGTETETLLRQLEIACQSRHIQLSREWVRAGYGGQVVYTLTQRGETLTTLTIEGMEGKTARSAAYKQLETLLNDVLARPLLSDEEQPTHPLGEAHLPDDVYQQMIALGAVKQQAVWYCPENAIATCEPLLAPYRYVSLGRLTSDEERLLRRNLPEKFLIPRRHYEFATVVKYQARAQSLLTDFHAGQKEVRLGRPTKRANDALRALGAWWDGGAWVCRARHEAQAREIIAQAEREDREEQAAELKRSEEKRAAERAAGIIQIERGEGYGGEAFGVGEVVWVDETRYRPDGAQGWYVVLSAKSHYIREDGMSFGVGEDSGYLFSATLRPATAEEAAPHQAKAEAAQQRRQRRQAIEQGLRNHFAANAPDAEYPAGPITPQGVRVNIGEGQNIYGTGEWFVLDNDGTHVWHVRNNGMDGDNWAYNNIGTGGAGAIGHRFPLTPERREILTLAQAAQADNAN
jgi:hypothetical protein